MSSPKTFYLAHPYAHKAEGKRIQTELEKLGLTIINPFERGEQAIYDHKLKGSNIGTALSDKDCEDIVRMDLAKIDGADGVIALMIHPEMLGTIMEMFYVGHVLKRPLVVYAPTPRYSGHPWVRFYATEISQSEAELYELFRR